MNHNMPPNTPPSVDSGRQERPPVAKAEHAVEKPALTPEDQADLQAWNDELNKKHEAATADLMSKMQMYEAGYAVDPAGAEANRAYNEKNNIPRLKRAIEAVEVDMAMSPEQKIAEKRLREESAKLDAEGVPIFDRLRKAADEAALRRGETSKDNIKKTMNMDGVIGASPDLQSVEADRVRWNEIKAKKREISLKLNKLDDLKRQKGKE